MQAAALITCMASNCAEPSAEAAASGQGIKVNSALQSQTKDTLFTSILQQGIAGNGPISLDGGDIQLTINTDDAKKADESVDVCSLLMQLMVMNSADQSGSNNGGNADANDKNGILGVINEISLPTTDAAMKGLNNAASVILQNDGKAAEVLSALAASDNKVASNNGQPKGEAAGTQFDNVLAGITEALESEMKQNGAVQDVQAAGAADMKNSAATRGLNETMPAAANNDGSKTAVQPDGLNILSADTAAEKSALSGNTAGNNAGGDEAGTHSERGFTEITVRDKNRTDETGAAENGINQIFNGADQKSETIAEKTIAVEKALDRFTNDLRSLRSGNQEIRIVLEPESLGVLIISVTKTESGISAKIKSEDKEVAAIISEHLQKLVYSMQSKGITVDDVDVVYSQLGQNTSFNQHGFSQARDESSRGYTQPGNKNPDTEITSNDLWQNFYSGETSSDTTVDYRV